MDYFNNLILKEASKLRYIVKDVAPSTEAGLFNCGELVVWSGESDKTIFQDAQVNWAFRALHDTLHLITGLGFSPEEEILLGKIQAGIYARECNASMADLVYCEVSLQAEYFKTTGTFVPDQIAFTKTHWKN